MLPPATTHVKWVRIPHVFPNSDDAVHILHDLVKQPPVLQHQRLAHGDDLLPHVVNGGHVIVAAEAPVDELLVRAPDAAAPVLPRRRRAAAAAGRREGGGSEGGREMGGWWASIAQQNLTSLSRKAASARAIEFPPNLQGRFCAPLPFHPQHSVPRYS